MKLTWQSGNAVVRWSRDGKHWYNSSIVTVERARQLALLLGTNTNLYWILLKAKGATDA